MRDIGGTLQTLFTPDEREENDRREENDDFRTPTTTTTATERGRGVDKENFEIFKSFTEGPPTVGFKRKKTNLSSSRKTPQLTKPSSPLSLGGSGGGGFTSALAAARGDGGGVVDGFGDEGGNRGPLQRFIVSQYDKNQRFLQKPCFFRNENTPNDFGQKTSHPPRFFHLRCAGRGPQCPNDMQIDFAFKTFF